MLQQGFKKRRLNIRTGDIASITGGRLYGSADIPVRDLVTDSRMAGFAGDAAFIAIRGNNHDGHNFIGSLFLHGVRAFIVSALPTRADEFQGAAFVIVDDTIKALQLIAAFRRKEFRAPVIAVTGSAGKTIVKEWLAEVLGRTAAVIRSPKSYNSQTGVPLSVWKLDDRFSYGIFEAGISKPGEMEKLQKIIDPDIGIITNIGDAHSENFPDLRTKAREKLKLFSNASAIVFCSDHTVIRDEIFADENLRKKRLIDWSLKNPDAAVSIRIRKPRNGFTRLETRYGDVAEEFEIPFMDRASVENAATVAAVCLALGISTPVIREGLAGLISVAMRMELKSGINGCNLIEDYYNSDPGSLSMAVEYLKLQNSRKTALILSDFIQSGRNEKELYGEVAGLVTRSGIDRFIGIGPALMRNKPLFGEGSSFYPTTEDFIRSFGTSGMRDETVLIKGARVFEFERIGKLLEYQVHTTILEVNLDAIAHNLNEFRRYLNPGTRIMAMVKAFAYGAGPAEIASFLEYHRVNYLAVAYADEGIELRNSGIGLPVMVMNPDPSSDDLMIQNNLEPEIYSFSSLTRFIATASRYGLLYYPVHIKIDSGMHRLGFMPGDIDSLCRMIKDRDCIRIASVFSHLASSENPLYDEFTGRQVKTFTEAAGRIGEVTNYPFLRHILNTSGILRFPQYQFDMVRPGIGIYGAGKFEGLDLRPAGTFKTRVSQVKRIPGGEPVGYGCADVSDSDRTIAILSAGYADGLNRKLGNGIGQVFLDGRKIPLVGNICMDMCMADVTGLDISEGDEAEIFGPNIPIDELAEHCGTIPYEILTSIPGRVKRIFFRE